MTRDQRDRRLSRVTANFEKCDISLPKKENFIRTQLLSCKSDDFQVKRHKFGTNVP